MNRLSAFGCEVDFQTGSRPDFALFNESQSRIIVSLNAQNEARVRKICAGNNIEINFIGKVTGKKLKINDAIEIDVSTIGSGYFCSIKNIMES
jgi:phosphoribosylformylglycinamidine synthase